MSHAMRNRRVKSPHTTYHDSHESKLSMEVESRRMYLADIKVFAECYFNLFYFSFLNTALLKFLILTKLLNKINFTINAIRYQVEFL
jgi:hypothetical protein